MSDPAAASEAPRAEDMHALLFGSLILQLSNTAMVFLGEVPHPEKGQPMVDLDRAQMFIDQLDMLAFKTRGNLSKDEDRLLKETLMALRLAFVKAADRPGVAPASASEAGQQKTEPSPSTAPETGSAPDPDDDKKKFVKKY
jgi:hypothetical protein